MANKVNDWQNLLKLANKDIACEGYKIEVYKHSDEEFDDLWTVEIEHNNEPPYCFADNYYESELSECINDAWANVRAKIKGLKKIYYTATALYNNDDNHSAESGVFSSEEKAMAWLEKQAAQWKVDQDIDDGDFEMRVETRRIMAYDTGTYLYNFDGTVGEVYMDNPEGPITDLLKRNQKIINKRKEM